MAPDYLSRSVRRTRSRYPHRRPARVERMYRFDRRVCPTSQRITFTHECMSRRRRPLAALKAADTGVNCHGETLGWPEGGPIARRRRIRRALLAEDGDGGRRGVVPQETTTVLGERHPRTVDLAGPGATP